MKRNYDVPVLYVICDNSCKERLFISVLFTLAEIKHFFWQTATEWSWWQRINEIYV